MNKYVVEISSKTRVDLEKWAKDSEIIKEWGGDKKEGYWFHFGFDNIKKARKFRTKAKQEKFRMVRIFKVVYTENLRLVS